MAIQEAIPPDHDAAIDHALRAIVEGTAPTTGVEFFRALVRHLTIALNVRFAFVAEFTDLDRRTRVRTLAYWKDNDFADNVEYDLEGTPCLRVAQGETVYLTRGVCTLFPEDKGLVALNVESYFGVPLLDASGRQLGHLAVLDDKPMAKEFRGMAILTIFAARAMAELNRQREEQARHDSEERLAAILASAMDAIVTLDDSHRVTLFNAAAEKVFRCPVARALGQPMEGFFSKRFNNLLQGYCLAVQPETVSHRQLWAPEGLTARRADGEEFPIEATISPLEAGGRRYYTIILRDITERRQAEEQLQKLHLENVYLQEVAQRHHDGDVVIGDSAAGRRVFEQVEQVAATDATVLLTGETGTGKEVVARAIHNASPRRSRLLVTVNCAALPGELIESELFGHEKGAFTGATAQRKGRFELADGGTLFLDEVGELTAPAQAKLLRALQEQAFERVGGTRTLKVNVRVIAATNRDLEEMVKAGQFRADLYYRLNVFPIRVPALRERAVDIPLLARHFLARFARRLGRPLRDIAPDSLERLRRYPWPGNIRELQNVIERAVILCKGRLLEVDNALDLRLAETPAAPANARTLVDIERAHILAVLEETRWMIEGERGAARILGLNPSTLRSRLQKLNIRKPRP
ncbi:MAG: sigma 54-interacting transcriptional regulator [Pseudomonadota bacterium]|nr:sigma 54-interacting transcriptional regulator [Pseudomonadota bacterium]